MWNKNNYKKITYQSEDKTWFGRSCPVCGKPLSSTTPVCFGCPIHSKEYYERRKKEREEKQI